MGDKARLGSIWFLPLLQPWAGKTVCNHWHILWSNTWDQKNPGLTPQKTTLEMFTGKKFQVMEVEFCLGVHMFIKSSKMSRLTPKRPLQWPQAASRRTSKNLRLQTLRAAIMEMYTPITHFVGSFLQQVIGILGHTMCLYLVFEPITC